MTLLPTASHKAVAEIAYRVVEAFVCDNADQESVTVVVNTALDDEPHTIEVRVRRVRPAKE